MLDIHKAGGFTSLSTYDFLLFVLLCLMALFRMDLMV